MARRIEIELTSARPDGSWTWRAAGAKEPKGVLDGALLYPDAKPGDVVKAEAEFELEGIVITSVAAPRADGRPEPQRIEVIGPGRADTPGVTTQLVGRAGRRPPGERRRERDETRGPGRDRPARSQTQFDPGRSRREPPEGRQTQRSSRREPGDQQKTGRDRNRERSPGEGSPSRAKGRTRPDAEAAAERAKRLNPSNTHRKAVLESLPPEQRLIAEQVLRGGVPAVRTALHLEREKAVAEGRPAPNTDDLVAMAESLLPRLKAAEWRDRAEAAVASAQAISLRDLRSVVAGADVARDEETRTLATQLREALDSRIKALHEHWYQEIAQHLEETHVVRALRLSARPPEPGARLPAELSTRLAEAAGQAMAPDAPPERWMALLEAAAASPIRRNAQPAGLPTDPPPDLKRAIHQHSGNIPALASLLGLSMPPPPMPIPARRRQPNRRPDRRPAQQPARRQQDGSGAEASEPQEGPDATERTAETRSGSDSPADNSSDVAQDRAPAQTAEPQAPAGEALSDNADTAPAEDPDRSS